MNRRMICDKYTRGMSIREIADELDLNPETIRYHLKKNNIKMRKAAPRGHNIDEDKIINLYSSGMDCRQISEIFNVSSECIRNRLKSLDIDRRSISETNILRDNRKLSFKGDGSDYWLGFLAANGHKTKTRNRIQLALQYMDRDHLRAFCNFIGLENPNIETIIYKSKVRDVSYLKARIKVESANLVNDLSNLNFEDFKHNGAELTIENKIDFIRGFFDGDGILTISNNKKGIRYQVGLVIPKNSQWIIKLLDDLHIEYNKYDYHKDLFHIYIKNKCRYKFLDTIYSSGVCLDRKHNKYNELKFIDIIKNAPTAYADGPIPSEWVYPRWSDDELSVDIDRLLNWKPDNLLVNTRRNKFGSKYIMNYNINFWHSGPDIPVIEAFNNDVYKKYIKYINSDNKTFYGLLRQLRYSSKYRYPSLMSPQLSMNVINKWAKDGVIYDPCAGWGSRYLSAIAMDNKYICSEPNPRTRAGLRYMAQKLKSRIKLLNRRIEDGPPPRIDANIIWTSPSFGSETYAGGPSINAHQAIKGILDIAFYLLPKNGEVILHLPNDIKPIFPPCEINNINDNYGGSIYTWNMSRIKRDFKPSY